MAALNHSRHLHRGKLAESGVAPRRAVWQSARPASAGRSLGQAERKALAAQYGYAAR